MKKLLELVDANNKTLFVDVESIAAIAEGNRGEGTCMIYFNCTATPFVVRLTYFDLIKKLTDIKVAQLEKF